MGLWVSWVWDKLFSDPGNFYFDPIFSKKKLPGLQHDLFQTQETHKPIPNPIPPTLQAPH